MYPVIACTLGRGFHCLPHPTLMYYWLYNLSEVLKTTCKVGRLGIKPEFTYNLQEIKGIEKHAKKT